MFSDLHLKTVPNGKYELTRDFTWKTKVKEGDVTFIVPKGFVTDLASIPRLFRWFITGHELRRAAVVHDYLYQMNYGSRREVDLLFRKAMRDAGVKKIKMHLAYLAVRIGGAKIWNFYGESNA